MAFGDNTLQLVSFALLRATTLVIVDINSLCVIFFLGGAIAEGSI